MAVTIKTEEEIKILREGGKRLAFILSELVRAAKPGVSSLDLENLAQRLTKEGGDKAAFLNYSSKGSTPFPAALCVSINNEIVHGLPINPPKILKEGDLVSLDIGLIHKGLFTDSAVTIGIGKIDEAGEKLLEVTKQSLVEGIKAVKEGNSVYDISFAIEKYVRPKKYGIVEELCGHGVGYKVHEDPYIPNYCLDKSKKEKLKAGMVIAIEPMLNEGSKKIKLADDGFTYITADGKRSAHFEHTVVVTKNGVEVLTVI